MFVWHNVPMPEQRFIDARVVVLGGAGFLGSHLSEKLMAEGRDGVMSGAGFYDYGGRPADELFRARDIELLQLKRALEAIEKRRTL